MLFATVILLIYMATFRQMAGVAADPVVALGLVRNPSPMVHSILALILLLLATVLGVYKPFGMTAYGKRQQGGHPAAQSSPVADVKPVRRARWVYFAWVVVVSLILLFVKVAVK